MTGIRWSANCWKRKEIIAHRQKDVVGLGNIEDSSADKNLCFSSEWSNLATVARGCWKVKRIVRRQEKKFDHSEEKHKKIEYYNRMIGNKRIMFMKNKTSTNPTINKRNALERISNGQHFLKHKIAKKKQNEIVSFS